MKLSVPVLQFLIGIAGLAAGMACWIIWRGWPGAVSGIAIALFSFWIGARLFAAYATKEERIADLRARADERYCASRKIEFVRSVRRAHN